ncbi:hypothetical protein GGR26_000888 [Lewinella marina]|uniref:Apea-like HEPN domain-containing protein n=1 Tax=Neolewinella marina TaxID=438751 RepID=A0A2G0CIB6_9BACT|nr:HEPN domain-containing protein [Neolewinella marina]NJB85143.1 hypothetical protein [Neolewinella marina]PHK99722.1 hypothetical protein CGL56_01340 [Neolewinella marina]
MPSNFIFELLCIDPDDISDQRGFIHAISYSNDVWNGRSPIITKDKNGHDYIKGESGLTVSVINVDTSKILTDLVEAAFVLRVESPMFEPLEPFRQRLLRHLSEKLRFAHLRVLQDDISSEIANQLYPKINSVENLLRRYLIKFFFQRVGMSWWEVTATPKMIEKVKARQRNRSNQFSYFINSDIEFADFDDLGLLIYKQSTGFNEPEKVLEKLTSIETLEELQELKSNLEGNYTKYFKTFFRDKNFERLWKEMSKIRNKVAHQATFFHSELRKGIELSAELTSIIKEAESHIDEIVLSLKEKQAIHQAAAEVVREEQEEAEAAVQQAQEITNRTSHSSPEESAAASLAARSEHGQERGDHRVKLTGPKIIGKIKLEHKTNTYRDTAPPGYRVITAEEILEELHEALHLNFTTYVGLKWFVTQYLANKGYAIGTTYSLVNILIEQTQIELYDYESSEGYMIKAVRLPKS